MKKDSWCGNRSTASICRKNTSSRVRFWWEYPKHRAICLLFMVTFFFKQTQQGRYFCTFLKNKRSSSKALLATAWQLLWPFIFFRINKNLTGYSLHVAYGLHIFNTMNKYRLIPDLSSNAILCHLFAVHCGFCYPPVKLVQIFKHKWHAVDTISKYLMFLCCKINLSLLFCLNVKC